MSAAVRVAVVGGSGYTGGELLRLLLQHPYARVEAVTSRRHAGRPVWKVHPNLRGRTDLKFIGPEALEEYDTLFLALPHGTTMEQVDEYAVRAQKLIDLSADFRLKDPAAYLRYYGKKHPRPQLLKQFVYGLPELHRAEIQGAKWVAVPGCTATAAVLPLWPLVQRFPIRLVVIDAKVGSSAAGSEPSPASHHPERAGVVRSFQPTGHRHLAEMEQELNPHGSISLNFSPHAVELVRGILSTAHVFFEEGFPCSEQDVWQAYLGAYRGEPFVRFVKGRSGLYRYPEPKLLLGTNFCDIGFEKDERTGRLVVMAAIDNLMKGAAGQAVQCFNLMWGFDERMGLDAVGFHPI